MNGLFFGFLLGLLAYPWFGAVGILLGGILGFLADASSGRRGGGAFGSETRDLVVRLFALWGRIASHGGFNQMQGLFLQSVSGQLRLTGALAREAFAAFEESREAASGRPWTEVLTDTANLAREIYEDYFLDRRTLVWVYATCRRLAGLGTVRPGIVELLDAVAKAFTIFEEVGSAGIEGSREQQYEQAWQNFRPASTATPEAYATLGLTADATVEEIKKAYRSLVRQHHPDSGGQPERFLQVQQAYERIRQSRKF